MTAAMHRAAASNSSIIWRYLVAACALLFVAHRLFASNAAPTASHGKKYIYDWPRPALTVDTVLVTSESRPKVLLIQRDHEPNTGSWALSGGFVNENEPLETAAERELEEETTFPPSKVGMMVQVKTYGDSGRDPRGWIVGVVYAALVPSALGVKANDDAAGAKWWNIEELPLPLAIDHEKILVDVFIRLAQEEGASKVKDLKKVLLRAADKLEKQLRR